jgi:hypothetical protein
VHVRQEERVAGKTFIATEEGLLLPRFLEATIIKKLDKQRRQA